MKFLLVISVYSLIDVLIYFTVIFQEYQECKHNIVKQKFQLRSLLTYKDLSTVSYHPTWEYVYN